MNRHYLTHTEYSVSLGDKDTLEVKLQSQGIHLEFYYPPELVAVVPVYMNIFFSAQLFLCLDISYYNSTASQWRVLRTLCCVPWRFQEDIEGFTRQGKEAEML